ncbi:MAG: DUF4352 domain-containing protein, partial [Chloroflexi bacterium]|nr:DUF4352 domain-containing protein [Chloroflexota bacterium]
APLVLGVGDIAQESGLQFSVTQVSSPYQPKDASIRPSRGEFLVAVVDLHNFGTNQLTVAGKQDFTLLDARGTGYPDTTIPELPPTPNGTIGPSTDVTGDVAFDVPKGADYRLAFHNEGFAHGVIMVDLSRSSS